MTIHLKGLTWDHPRATSPLFAANRVLNEIQPDVILSWEVQPLSSFEDRPISEAAGAYDLIIFDHPHVGEIAEGRLLRPVDLSFPDTSLLDADFVGPSLKSYRYGGHVWGLPLDAACQVSCARPDLIRALVDSSPTDWAMVLELGEQALRNNLRLAMAFAGVHSLMTLLTLCANQEAPLAMRSVIAFADRDAVRTSLLAMRGLLTFCAPESLNWNSIAVQEAMTTRDDLVFCPAVYGFSSYGHRNRKRRLDYGNLPGIRKGAAGSTLGGAGIGISAYSRHPEAAFAAARFLTSARIQEEVIASNDGQPSRVNAWESLEVNRISGQFYEQTRRTIEQAWIRPCFNGYLRFQRAGGRAVEAYLRAHTSIEATINSLETLWSDALRITRRHL